MEKDPRLQNFWRLTLIRLVSKTFWSHMHIWWGHFQLPRAMATRITEHRLDTVTVLYKHFQLYPNFSLPEIIIIKTYKNFNDLVCMMYTSSYSLSYKIFSNHSDSTSISVVVLVCVHMCMCHMDNRDCTYHTCIQTFSETNTDLHFLQ